MLLLFVSSQSLIVIMFKLVLLLVWIFLLLSVAFGFEAYLCGYRCDATNWEFQCSSAKHDKWCYATQEGCPLNSYEKFEKMTECHLYMRGKLNKSLECMYHCDETSNRINTCLESSQICVQGFHESEPPDDMIVKYDKRSNFNNTPRIKNSSWCRLMDTKWYPSYDNCVNGIRINSDD